MGQFEYGQAREVFSRLAAAHPDRADLRINLAVATLHRQQDGDAAAARRILEQVLAADPDNLRAHYNLGLLLLHEGHAAEALPHFTYVTGRDSADAYAWYFLGQSQAQQGDAAGALPSFERALAIDPHLRSAAYGAYQAMQRTGHTGAPRMLEAFQALESNPQSEVAEFKYTRLGPLAQAATIDEVDRQRTARPDGPVFEETPMQIAPAPAPAAWRTFPLPDGGGAARPASITAADVDGDGRIDLFIAGGLDDRGITRNAVLLNRGASGFALDRAHPLASVPDVQAALWGDYDNDGLTDVYLCRRGANQLWRQTAPGQWANVTAAARADGGGGTTIDGAMFDADHDGDLDLFLVKDDGPNELLNNNGDGTFRRLGATIGLADRRPSVGVVVADLDADRDADILAIRRAPPHDVRVNDRAWRYRADAAFTALARSAMTSAVAGDVDADGHPELYASDADGVRRWMRAASGSWEESAVAGTRSLANAAQLALADVDGDGRLDLIGAGADGRWRAFALSFADGATLLFAGEGAPVAGWTLAVLDAARGPSIVAMPAGTGGPPRLWQPGAGRFAFAALTLSGRDSRSRQLRSNMSGIGVQLAARVGSRWTALSTYRPQSGVGQSLQPITIGLGGAPQVDFVSLTWSDGVFQSELALVPGPVQQIAETERQLSSCPVLFAFDGKRFAFVTDVLGVGGIGTQTSPGVYDVPRPRENVLLPANLLAVREGRYALKIMEPMEEVAYIDAARLVAYDIPPGYQLVLDERRATSGPEATGEPRYYREERVPVQARSEDGVNREDVTRAVAAADGVAAPPGRVDPRHIGRTDEHALTLRFASDLDRGSAMLVADGWVEYPYAQTLFAAWQAGAPYRAPTLEARGADGRWKVVRREFGYPAGMPRRMSVPLGRLPAGTRELRLTTTQEIYWDRLAVAYDVPCPLASKRLLPLASARLARTGFARRETHAGRRPSYDYDRRSPLWDVRYPKGRYTAEGTVTDLLAGEDGAVAIIGPGEELHLEFESLQPAPKPGWTRRFVLEARGWCKDMDLYTRDGDTVDPVPGLRTAASERLQQRYTTRYQSGR